MRSLSQFIDSVRLYLLHVSSPGSCLSIFLKTSKNKPLGVCSIWAIYTRTTVSHIEHIRRAFWREERMKSIFFKFLLRKKICHLLCRTYTTVFLAFIDTNINFWSFLSVFACILKPFGTFRVLHQHMSHETVCQVQPHKIKGSVEGHAPSWPYDYKI